MDGLPRTLGTFSRNAAQLECHPWGLIDCPGGLQKTKHLQTKFHFCWNLFTSHTGILTPLKVTSRKANARKGSSLQLEW